MTQKLPLKDTPLRVTLEHNQIVIRIGISTTAFCAEHSDWWAEIKEQYPKLRIVNEKELANDTLHAMQVEEEDGSSPLTNFLDKAIQDALDNGSLGVDFD